MKPTSNRPGRPPAESFSDAELAQLLELPVQLVRARCRLSFFCGAEEQVDGSWTIPAKAARLALRANMEPLYSINSAARLLDVSHVSLRKIVHGVNNLDSPLPSGKRLRALLLYVGAGAPVKRVPESELRRFIGGLRAS